VISKDEMKSRIYTIALYLSDLEWRSIKDICDATRLTKHVVQYTLDHMSDGGFVSRTRDRSGTSWAIKSKGLEFIARRPSASLGTLKEIDL